MGPSLRVQSARKSAFRTFGLALLRGRNLDSVDHGSETRKYAIRLLSNLPAGGVRRGV
jgi:hypothetical protein